VTGVEFCDAIFGLEPYDGSRVVMESVYDQEGNNVGKGKKSQILLISLDKPLPLTSATVSARWTVGWQRISAVKRGCASGTGEIRIVDWQRSVTVRTVQILSFSVCLSAS
jgi:hypothetical protein